ncbi:MAG: type IV secretion system DNA-binding domain-containing protein [bacterium]
MQFKEQIISQNFSSPEEELLYLRNHLKEREALLKREGHENPKEQASLEVVKQYAEVPKEQVLAQSLHLPEKHEQALVLRLEPESHDRTMEELLGILLSKGVRNALSVVEKMNDPHIEDDFHRFLVQYLIAEQKIPGLKEGTALHKSLNTALFKISMPDKNASDTRDWKIILGAIEQFFAGMQFIGDGRDNKDESHYSIEFTISHNEEQVVLFVGVPRSKIELFEKQLLSVYPLARIEEAPNDYNIFAPNCAVSGAVGFYAENDVFPIKTYDMLDQDPIESIINAFNKIKATGEGAAIQFIIRPSDEGSIKHFHSLLGQAQKGEKIEKEKSGIFGEFDTDLKNATKDLIFNPLFGMFSDSDEKDEKKEEKKEPDEKVVSAINDKLKSTMTGVNIRMFTSAETADRAKSMLNDLESVFAQFTRAGSNAIHFKELKKNNQTEVARDFTFRNFRDDERMVMNLKELATLVHFPYGIGSMVNVEQARAGQGPAPIEMSKNGVLLGYNEYRGVRTPIHFSREDRMRHLYVIGQTGTGKTVTLKQLIKQDIENGDGCCFIDPHGDDVQDILSYIPPHRIDDVIYFDPAYTARPMGLNMLEYDERFPEQKTFVINEMMNIFNQLFDMKAGGGAMFEQYFRNAAMLVMEDPESGSTLLEITRVLQDKAFRDLKLSKCKNPIIHQFWTAAEATTGDQGLANFVPYISSKFDPFVSNDIMRPVIGQQNSVFNFRKIMDEKKILLVNLSKGRLGEINANLIGLILVGKIQMAALSRTDMRGEQKNDFYLYIDEFQNVTTPAIASILSEARKYRLSLNVAHQYIAQLPEDTKNAIFGNVGSMCVMRVSPEDATFLESKFAPTFTASDITKQENLNAYVSMIVNGVPTQKPFNMHLAEFPVGNKAIVDSLKELSYVKYGRLREEVEAEIMAKYRK